jgi:hypothetical protein
MTGWCVNERALKEAFKDILRYCSSVCRYGVAPRTKNRVVGLCTWSEFVASRMFLSWRRVPNLWMALMNVDVACGVVKAHQIPWRGGPVGQGALKVENIEICCEFSHTGGPSDRRQYYGSIVWDLRVTWLQIAGLGGGFPPTICQR